MPSERTKTPGRKAAAGGKRPAKSMPTARAARPHKPAPATPATPATAAVPASRAKAGGGGRLIIEQYVSGIGYMVRQKRILRALGLRHPHHRVERPDNPAVRGMVQAIRHLVRIVEP